MVVYLQPDFKTIVLLHVASLELATILLLQFKVKTIKDKLQDSVDH